MIPQDLTAQPDSYSRTDEILSWVGHGVAGLILVAFMVGAFFVLGVLNDTPDNRPAHHRLTD